MAKALQQAEREFLERYRDWLDVVEDGLSSVVTFYREDLTENGDRLLLQMMEGFVPFSPENMTMQQVFGQEKETAEVMASFNKKTQQTVKMVREGGEAKQSRLQFVAADLLPVFQRWKLLVDGRSERT